MSANPVTNMDIWDAGYRAGCADVAERVENVIQEWRDTMQVDDKAAAVVRGIALELNAVIYADA